jgi:HD-GYP domain-containing protein (c-di-GMP phosphodiesterase class II)
VGLDEQKTLLQNRGILVRDLDADDPDPMSQALELYIVSPDDLRAGLGVRIDHLPEERAARALLIAVGTPPADVPASYFSQLPAQPQPAAIGAAIASGLEHLRLKGQLHETRWERDRRGRERDEITSIGIALSAERNLDRLLDLILYKSRWISDADAGSLYLKAPENSLQFKLAQNDSITANYTEFTMPIDPTSIAGTVALNKQDLNISDVYKIAPDEPYGFNPKYDRLAGYRTRSVLTIPMMDRRGDLIGVIQLINKKRDASTILDSPAVIEREVIPFPPSDVELMKAIAGQAGVTLENRQMEHQIQDLFEGFVGASVAAIESRDPTTSGHSTRVAELTVGLAQVVDASTTQRFEEIQFTRDQIKEIRYASLLHDFGKVGVREKVLVKANKLYEEQLELIKHRFALFQSQIALKSTKNRLQYMLEKGREAFMEETGNFDNDLEAKILEVDNFLKVVVESNRPSILEEGNFQALQEIAQMEYTGPEDTVEPLLSPQEITALSIRKGSLDPEERKEIESHVVHTFRFLNKIPWTPEMKNIPEIAGAHHEKLDGSGYPRGVKAADISIQSRMMTIADIYDALTARDRPYKAAVPVDRALQILEFEAKDGHIDQDLLDLFTYAKVFELTDGL